MQTGNTDFIYRNELDKACFNYDMAYGKSKYLLLSMVIDGYQRGLTWFKSFLIKSLVEVVLTLNQVISLKMNFIGRLLENLREEKFIHRLETIFGVLI